MNQLLVLSHFKQTMLESRFIFKNWVYERFFKTHFEKAFDLNYTRRVCKITNNFPLDLNSYENSLGAHFHKNSFIAIESK